MRNDAPVMVTALGGSGTRMIAAVLAAHGVYLGECFNPALDNLWLHFLLFNRDPFAGSEELRPLLELFARRMRSPESWNDDAIAAVHRQRRWLTRSGIKFDGDLNLSQGCDSLLKKPDSTADGPPANARDLPTGTVMKLGNTTAEPPPITGRDEQPARALSKANKITVEPPPIRETNERSARTLSKPSKTTVGPPPIGEMDERSARALSKPDKTASTPQEPWGFKYPPGYLFAPLLFDVFPGARMVFLERHPLDMAFSSNTNQLRRFGHWLGPNVERTPRWQLKLWLKAHDFVNSLSKRYAVRCVGFEALVSRPVDTFADLFAFLGLHLDPNKLDHVQPQNSIGRYRTHSLREFDRQDLNRVQSLGFSIDRN